MPDGRSRAIHFVTSAAEPLAVAPQAERLYADALAELVRARLPFLLAGTYAISSYTGIVRPTKDLDVFCRPEDCPRILDHFRTLGYRTEVRDPRWLAKVHDGEHFFDIIHALSNGITPITGAWFDLARRTEVLGTVVDIVGPTELLWSKAFVQVRDRYDGSDIVHLILKQHDDIDWQRLLDYMDDHWEVLLVHLLNFRWIYPGERERIPDWLMDELTGRLRRQLRRPAPGGRVCRGRLFSEEDFEIDIRDWGFVDPVAGPAGRDER